MIVVYAIPTLLILFYAGYLWRAARHFGRLRAECVTPEAPPFVSVIVPARNEAANIGGCLEAVFAQDYPGDRFEVIVVDDHSEDGTRAAAEAAAKGHANFRIVSAPDRQGPAYKKAAVAAGIALARGTIILTTDADCEAGPGWIPAMAAQFDEKTGMVSGPVVLQSDSMFGHFQALEFMGLIGVGAAAIAAGSPTMCNGANLAYRKTVFEAVGGFEGIDHIASGDDELLMHKIADETEYGIRYAACREAIVRTPALRSWSAFRAQRVRWVSKSTQYKRLSITLTLVLSWLAMAGFPMLLAAGFFDGRAWHFLLLNLLLKMAGEFPILLKSARFFNKLHLLKFFPAEQLAHIAYVLWVGIAGNRRNYVWKGRKVK